MEKYSIAEVIEQAVQTERLGAGFYSEMSEKFRDNKELSKLFKDLSEKERFHEETFLELKSRIPDNKIEGWDEFSAYLRAIAESAFFLGGEKSLAMLRNVETAYEAVQYALGFEKETLLYYVEVRGISEHTDVLDEIIREERRHIKALNSIKSSIIK